MIAIKLKERPVNFKMLPGNPTDKKLKNSMVVFTRKRSSKVTLQFREWHTDNTGHITNVHLDGDEAMQLIEALTGGRQ